MGEKKNGGGKKDDALSVVVKIDMHCAGCVEKIVKCVKAIDGVEVVKVEALANKMTVIGKMDPSELKEKLEHKTKKKVELVSPQQGKKDNKENKGGNNKDENKKKKSDDKPEKKTEEKKPKEPPVTTATLKMALHCQGCVEKIHKVLSRTKGVLEKAIDKQKNHVIVNGTMDVKALVERLKDRLKRPVEIVQPKEKKGGGDDKKEDGDGGGKGKKGGDGDGEAQNEANGGAQVEGSKMEYMGVSGFGHVGYGYGHGYEYSPYTPHPQYVYGYPGYGDHLHPPQMFSDENPNACSIM